jgi:BirA family biotin operon repressor/biotin-[acetyl-CoA-carboxylase] ligase
VTLGRLDTWDGISVEALRRRWEVPAVEAYVRIGSTNDRALELARDGCAPFTVIVAEEQSAGRGRQGTPWRSPSGCGLTMSVVLPPLKAAARSHMSLLVGLSTAEAIELCTPGAEVGIKWPNDLWLGRRKVGGILCEAVGESAVAGIGVNVRTPPGGFPSELRDIATSLEMISAISFHHSDLAESVIERLKRRLENAGPLLDRAALDALARRDVLEGRHVYSDEAGDGKAAEIAVDGALVLERADGSRARVVAGSVRLR